jgi:hypothetical protein
MEEKTAIQLKNSSIEKSIDRFATCHPSLGHVAESLKSSVPYVRIPSLHYREALQLVSLAFGLAWRLENDLLRSFWHAVAMAVVRRDFLPPEDHRRQFVRSSDEPRPPSQKKSAIPTSNEAPALQPRSYASAAGEKL